MRHPTWTLGLFLATLALGTDEYVIAGVLPQISTDLGVPVGATGQLVTAFALAFALGAPVLGVLFDPLPRRRVLFGGLAVFVLANALAAVAPGYGTLMALRILAGLAAAVVSSTAFAAAAQGAPEGQAGRYLSMVTAGLTTALFTGVPAGAWAGGHWGWRATFVLVAIVGAAAGCLLALTMPRLPGSPRLGLAARLSPLRRPAVVRLVLAVFLCGAGGLMFYTYLAPLLLRAGADESAIPWVLLEVGLIGVPSAFFGGWLADRLGGRSARLAVVGGHAVVLAGIAVLVGIASPLPALLVGIGLWSVFAWALNPPLQASTMEAAPDAPMTAVSLNISGLYLGTAAAAALGGVLADGPGVAWIPATAAALLCLAALSASFRLGHGSRVHISC